jgi:hypothetical protein
MTWQTRRRSRTRSTGRWRSTLRCSWRLSRCYPKGWRRSSRPPSSAHRRCVFRTRWSTRFSSGRAVVPARVSSRSGKHWFQTPSSVASSRYSLLVRPGPAPSSGSGAKPQEASPPPETGARAEPKKERKALPVVRDGTFTLASPRGRTLQREHQKYNEIRRELM